ncbi:hypothetical protein [Marinitenerispora sediminis]|uniref:hypothetical protein n=1 Tax=Marinitenerispora sediminis TaxID=1931232 RepID=UPI0015F19ED4|nr:hypothetical protein [Marinitenerispora sediminis]
MNRIRDFFLRRRTHGRDGGYTTETVLVIALLVALAVGAVGAIATTVQNRAESISLD